METIFNSNVDETANVAAAAVIIIIIIIVIITVVRSDDVVRRLRYCRHIVTMCVCMRVCMLACDKTKTPDWSDLKLGTVVVLDILSKAIVFGFKRSRAQSQRVKIVTAHRGFGDRWPIV